MNEISKLSAVAQAQLLADKKISSLELTNFYLERIEDLNPKLTAFSHVAWKKARQTAQKWDETHAHHKGKHSLLSGVPIGIKDLSMVRFMPAQMGYRSFKYFMPPFDDPNVARLRKAGLIILGKTSTSEFGATPFCPTKNPWDITRTPGGSSGGSAAAVAAGMLPIAHAADGGGSIRIPAALCGLIGFKASRHALHHVIFSDKLRMVTEGPIAKTLEDTAAFLKILAKDPKQFELSKSSKKFKIAFHTASPLAETDPEIIQATRLIAQKLEQAGHILEEKPWPEFTFDDFLPMWCKTLANVPVLKESCLEDITRWFRQEGKKITHQNLEQHVAKIKSIADIWWGDDIDFHLSPTVTCLAPKSESPLNETLEQMLARMVPLGAYTALSNVMGYAAVTLPVGSSQSGLPIGIQLMAPQGNDAVLLQLAQEI